jgi:hypothetical protein
MKKLFAGLAAIGIATAGIVGTAAAPAAASATAILCDDSWSIFVDGGKAVVRECHNYDTGQVRVNGWVEDTKADGRCAQVYADYWGNPGYYTGRDYSPRACPEGQRDTFTLPWRTANDALIYLRVVA